MRSGGKNSAGCNPDRHPVLLGIKFENSLVQERLTKRMTSLTKECIGRGMKPVLQIGNIHLGVIGREIVLINLMRGFIFKIVRGAELDCVVTEVFASMGTVEIECVLLR